MNKKETHYKNTLDEILNDGQSSLKRRNIDAHRLELQEINLTIDYKF